MILDARAMYSVTQELAELYGDGVGVPYELMERLQGLDRERLVGSADVSDGVVTVTPHKDFLAVVAAFREWRGVRPN